MTRFFTIACNFVLIFYTFAAIAQQNDYELITQTLNDYIEGTSYSNQNLIKRAFEKNAELLLENKETEVWRITADEYASWFKPENIGVSNGRIGELLSIDLEGNIATAKVEILVPSKSLRFVDLFLLKKLNTGWKILSKTAASENANNHAERILFIVSNAHFHGDTNLPAGVSFSEIVNAYETFKNSGYTVDFVSPEGGTIPLSYINTSEPIHKKYLYNSDFMYALKHTKSPTQIDPSKYRAVHYVGGSNAMYGVAENEAIQKIAMTIYEDHDGIISAVCHGTAGIVNLKTKDGGYLVDGKRISGYPEAYENQSRAYFKEFPLLIQQSIESRGGQFLYSDRNTPHIETDGRIVTGQNHLSSQLVAEKMIDILQRN